MTTPTSAPFPAVQTAGNTLQLEDIHLPNEPGFWPPAPGWWLLLILVLTGLFFAIRKLRLLMQQRREWRETRRALEILQQQLATGNEQQAVTDLNIFLRNMALTHFPDDDIASLTGNEWLKFLDRSGGTQAFTKGAGTILNEGPYRAQLPEKIDTTALIEAIQEWVKNVQKNQPRAIKLYPSQKHTHSGGNA